MSNVTNGLVASINMFRSSDNEEILNFDVTNLNFPSSYGQFVQNFPCAIGANNLTLPSATIYQLYVKNNGPTPGQGLSVILKNNQMAVADTVVVLYNGEVFISWQNPPAINGSNNAGYQSIQFFAQTACTVDYFIGA